MDETKSLYGEGGLLDQVREVMGDEFADRLDEAISDFTSGVADSAAAM